MIHAFSRSEMLLGTEAIEKLKNSRIAVFGVGGVGGYAVEALARSGVGELHLIDNDDVSLTNINRQIIALHSTVGQPKVDVMKARVLEINPVCRVFTYNTFFLPEKAGEFDTIRVVGLMTVPPICQNSADSVKFFQEMYNLSVDIKAKKYDNVWVDILSMGMSGDYREAIACGSTMIRVGTAIFGARDYH